MGYYHETRYTLSAMGCPLVCISIPSSFHPSGSCDFSESSEDPWKKTLYFKGLCGIMQDLSVFTSGRRSSVFHLKENKTQEFNFSTTTEEIIMKRGVRIWL